MENTKKKKQIKTLLIVIAVLVLAVITIIVIRRIICVKCIIEPLERAAQAEEFEEIILKDPVDGEIINGEYTIYEKETKLCQINGKLRLDLPTIDHSKAITLKFYCDAPILYKGEKYNMDVSIGPFNRLWSNAYSVGLTSSDNEDSSVRIGFRTDIDGELESDEYQTKSSDEINMYKDIKDEYVELLKALDSEYDRMRKKY